MKKFIIKLSLISIFVLLVFRFTFVSLINDYENKILNIISSSNLKEIKVDFFDQIENINKKDKIFNDNDAKILGVFINKLFNELKIK